MAVGNNSMRIAYNIEISKGYAAVPIATFLLTLVTNFFILATFTVMKKKQLKDVFIMGLAILDLLTLIHVGASAVTFVKGTVAVTDFICNLWALFVCVTLTSTGMFHCVICTERCLSIIKPVEHRLFLNKHNPYHLASGLVLTTFLAPMAYYVGLTYSGVLIAEFNAEIPTGLYRLNLNFFLTCAVPFIILPLILELVTHILIMRRVKTVVTHRRKGIKQTLKTVSLIIGLYYLCNTPAAIYMVWSGLFHDPPAALGFMCYHMACANSFMNFWIYLFTQPSFQEAFKNLLPFLPRKLPNQIANEQRTQRTSL